MVTNLCSAVLSVAFASFGELEAERDGIRFAVPPQTIWQADKEFVFAREPLLARMPDRSLVCVLYTGGRREPDTNNVVAVVRSTDDGETWTRPQVVFSHPHRACWATELNTLGERPELVFQTFDGNTYYSNLRPFRTWTEDNGKTWTPPVSYNGLPQSFTTRQGLRLADGAIVHPIYWQECRGVFDGWVSYTERGVDFSDWHRNGQWWFASGSIRSDDGGSTWTFAAVPQAGARKGRMLDQWEPAIVEIAPGKLKMFVRVGSDERVLWESESVDGGRSWTRLHPGEIANPGTKMQVLSHKGKVILFNNTCERERPDRFRLEAMVSSDGCWSWRHIPLADSSRSKPWSSDWFNTKHVQVAYPSALLDDGSRTCYLAIDSVGKFYLMKIPYEKLGLSSERNEEK